jgi:hypothetical protein
VKDESRRAIQRGGGRQRSASLGYFPTKVTEKVDRKATAARKSSGGKQKKAAGSGFGWVAT